MLSVTTTATTSIFVSGPPCLIQLAHLPKKPFAVGPSFTQISPLLHSLISYHSLSSFHPNNKSKTRINMSKDERGNDSDVGSKYQEALDALSTLITMRSKADKSNQGDRFDVLFDYIKMLDLEEAIQKMKIIHVAGTKGKGSTCMFTESILRHCGFRTGVFTSPHLIDIRERFRLDGVEICEEKFLAYFWWCFDRLKKKINEDVPMPTYFRFLALLGFKIFSAEQVDVAILEVGLGGKFDATNVAQAPIVCGISSLGYDHMEILGNTLGQIAGEKAGILKREVPAFTVPQPEEAMFVIEKTASELDVPLQIAHPLDISMLNGLQLGLDGEHQLQNAGLAVALSGTWLRKTGHSTILDQTTSLPEQFIKGLANTNFQGRAQIVPDPYFDTDNQGDLIFYLDGAHSPESMEVCGKWFCRAIKDDFSQHKSVAGQPQDYLRTSSDLVHNEANGDSGTKSTKILLFNCMAVRDPQVLLPCLINACAHHGVHFQKAFFVPNQSLYAKVGSYSVPQADPHVDLSWQLKIQRVWENLIRGDQGTKAGDDKVSNLDEDGKEEPDQIRNCENSSVYASLPLALKWLRDSAQQNRSVRFQVLVTGSLHLVGDVLKIIKK